MTPQKMVALLFAVASLACAIKAAKLWLQASRKYPPEMPQSIGDAPAVHILNVQVSFGEAGELNAKAAVWTGAAAVLSAVSSIIALL